MILRAVVIFSCSLTNRHTIYTERQWPFFSSLTIYESESESCSVVSNTLWPHELYSPWNSLGQNTRVDSPSLLQRIFLTQESNQRLLHCRWILYKLSTSGKPYDSFIDYLIPICTLIKLLCVLLVLLALASKITFWIQ